MSDFVRQFAAMNEDLRMLKASVGSMLQVGPIEEVDDKKGYRVKYGDGYLSRWIPHPESGKTSIPLKKGDVVGVMHVGGDAGQALMFRAGFSGIRPSPTGNVQDDVLLDEDGTRIERKGGVLRITAGSKGILD